MAAPDTLAHLIAGNVDELNRPADTDTALKLTEKSLRRRRLPVPMTIASHVTGIGRIPDTFPLILIQEGPTAIGGLKGAVRASFAGQMPHLTNQLELVVDGMYQMIQLVHLRVAQNDVDAATQNLVYPRRLFEALQPMI